MKVLVACEESQTVCKAFREKGHEAYSCDIIECSGGHPEWHIKQDVIPLLDGRCEFKTCDGLIHEIEGKWDLIIAHPPCTYLTVTQNWCYNREKYGDEKVNEREKSRDEAIDFFMAFTKADCERVAIENPVGCMSRIYKKPTQIIQPYYFGDTAKKTTCLWLKGLPQLQPTNIVDCGEVFEYKGKNGRVKKYPKWMYDALGKSQEERQRIRSKTFEGIAKAMADQWGEYEPPYDVVINGKHFLTEEEAVKYFDSKEEISESSDKAESVEYTFNPNKLIDFLLRENIISVKEG